MSERATFKVCEISGKQLRNTEAMPINYIKDALIEIIKKIIQTLKQMVISL